MSREEIDLDCKPRTTTVKPVRSSRMTTKVEQVDYCEAELDTDTDSESNLSNSGTIIVDSPYRETSRLTWSKRLGVRYFVDSGYFEY